MLMDDISAISWVRDDEVLVTGRPVLIPSLDTAITPWAVTSSREQAETAADPPAPSGKQLEALNRFAALDPAVAVNAIKTGLNQMADRAERTRRAWGSMLNSPVAFRRSATWLRRAAAEAAFRYSHLIVPTQSRASCRFVLVYLEIPVRGRRFPYEVELLFADEQICLAGEHSGLWTRLEWEYEFDTTDFRPDAAAHPYY